MEVCVVDVGILVDVVYVLGVELVVVVFDVVYGVVFVE